VAVVRLEALERQPFLRILRMEIEREPCDLGAEPAPQPLDHGLAEAAERSEVVAPDPDLVACVLVHAA
jgi:hypothetical protein